ncbi:hypothetical protein, partial [Aeromonas hydrophila]
NERSHWSGNGVHVESELVFMIGRNMQRLSLLPSSKVMLSKDGFSRLQDFGGCTANNLALSRI